MYDLLMPIRFIVRFIKKALSSALRLIPYGDLILIIKRRLVTSEPKIAIVVIYQYHAEYLSSLVRSDPQFVFRHSRYRYYDCDKRMPKFEWSDPGTLDVVLTDNTDFLREGFTKQHRLLLRMQHSPGFGLWVPLYLYEKIKSYHGKLMIPIYVWNLAMKCRCLDEQTEKMRALILKDKMPLLFTHYDPKMNAIFNCPRTINRREGTALVALNWRMREKKCDIKLVIKAIDFLRRGLKVKVLYHPIIRSNDFRNRKPLLLLNEYLDKHNIESQMGISPIKELVNLYDEYDFILTDGSGSVYEAIVRGCKALTLEGLTYQRDRNVLRPTVEMGLLPKTSVWDYQGHPGIEQDLNFVKTYYGSHSLTGEDVTPFIRQEIIDAFKNW